MRVNKLKIFYIGDATSPHIVFWAKKFYDLGHEVHVISPYNSIIENVYVHPIKTRYNKFVNFILSYFKIRRLIKKGRPDLIHANFLGSLTFLVALTGFHPFIGTVWGSDLAIFRKKNLLSGFMFRYILKKSDSIEVSDRATKDFLHRNYSLDNKKIDFPYWGVDTKELIPIKKKKKFDIIYLRKSSKKYSTTTFIEAINLVKKKFPYIVSVLRRDKGYSEAENLIKEYQLDKSFIGLDWMPHEKIVDLMNSSIIYVDSFKRDTPGAGIGIATMEAMACGLPIIIADNPGVEEYVKHNYNGLVYKGGDYVELSKFIVDLLRNKKLRERLGNNARKTIVDKLNWDRISKKIEGKYLTLVEEYTYKGKD